MAVGLLALYLPGVLWLGYGFPVTTMGAEFSGIGLARAIEFGAAPFIVADMLKVALAGMAFPLIWRMIGR